MNVTSSSLLAKLENVNWCYSMKTVIHGLDTTLLVKYVMEDNAYAIMLSDFSSTYFECLIGDQIDQHFTRFNKSKLDNQQIRSFLFTMIQDLRQTQMKIEKLQVDCHTNRITIRTSKMFKSLKFTWNFYIISTEQEIFLRHFSMPMFRGLMHYYKLANNRDDTQPNTDGSTGQLTNNNGTEEQPQQSGDDATTTVNKVNNHTNNDSVNNPNTDQLPASQLMLCLNNDSILGHLFRYD